MDLISGEERSYNLLNDGAGGFAFIIFSDARQNKGGWNLAQYLKDNNLGSIIESDIRRNPNTRNDLRVWIWGVDRVALEEWQGKHRKRIVERLAAEEKRKRDYEAARAK